MLEENPFLLDDSCIECRATRCDCCGGLITYDSFQLRIVDPTLCCDALLDNVRLRLEAARRIIDAGWPYLATPEGLSFTPPSPVGPEIVTTLRALGIGDELIFEGLLGVEADWERVAVLSNVGGRIAIGDLLAGAEETEVIDLPPGDLYAEVQSLGCWNARLRLVTEPGGTRGEVVGEVGIHTAFIAVRDVDNAARVELAVKTGFGDGFYPVYEVLKGEDLVGIEVVFIEDEEE
jgi:hypothetical protein